MREIVEQAIETKRYDLMEARATITTPAKQIRSLATMLKVVGRGLTRKQLAKEDGFRRLKAIFIQYFDVARDRTWEGIMKDYLENPGEDVIRSFLSRLKRHTRIPKGATLESFCNLLVDNPKSAADFLYYLSEKPGIKRLKPNDKTIFKYDASMTKSTGADTSKAGDLKSILSGDSSDIATGLMLEIPTSKLTRIIYEGIQDHPSVDPNSPTEELHRIVEDISMIAFNRIHKEVEQTLKDGNF